MHWKLVMVVHFINVVLKQWKSEFIETANNKKFPIISTNLMYRYFCKYFYFYCLLKQIIKIKTIMRKIALESNKYVWKIMTNNYKWFYINNYEYFLILYL